MKEKIVEKLTNENYVFTDKETEWMMKNIGNEESLVRDEIVFNALASGFVEGTFTNEQYNYIKSKTISDNLIFNCLDDELPQTLTRSFAALLNGFIIQVDSDSASPYYHQLTSVERKYFFNGAIMYLRKEQDKTGYSPRYGWVHAFAHGGDYLSKVVGHDLFCEEDAVEILKTVEHVLYSIETPFIDEEEKRIADVLYVGIKNKKIPTILLLNWLEKLDFSLKNNASYYQLATFKNMLAYVYFHCLNSKCLDDELRNGLLIHLRDY